MKKIFLSLFLQSSLVYGDIEIERSPTYFRDQLEVSQVAEIPVVDHKKLRLEFYKQGKLYKRFFKGSFEDFLKGSVGTKELEEGEEHTIVSLTSWPPRIHTVFLTIESILRQSHKPHKVLLYLSEAEFPTRELPETLKLQQARGLEVRWVKENLRSYKKLLYALKEFPESNIVTIDDDRMYDNRMLAFLVEDHAKNSIDVLSMKLIWQENFIVFSGGYAGIFYPSNSFDDRVFDVESFLKLSPLNDDEWFACAIAANKKIFKSLSWPYSVFKTNDSSPLSKEYTAFVNKELAINTLHKHNCMEYFNLYEKLNIKPNSKVLEYLENKKKK